MNALLKSQKLPVLFIVLSMAVLVAYGCSQMEFMTAKPVELDSDFQKILTYRFNDSREPLMVIQDRIRDSFGDKAARLNLELQLCEVLKNDVSRECKDFVCRQLMLIGTKASVKTLAAMLADTETADMARYALEKIPDTSADKALVKAMKSAEGTILIGIINSLGERRNTRNASAVKAYAGNVNADVAAAAKDALAKMGK